MHIQKSNELRKSATLVNLFRFTNTLHNAKTNGTLNNETGPAQLIKFVNRHYSNNQYKQIKHHWMLYPLSSDQRTTTGICSSEDINSTDIGVLVNLL